MEFLRNKKIQVMAVLFVLLLIGVVVYSKFSGLLLIASLFVFGTLSIIWKEKEVKIAGLAALVLLSLLNIGLNGMKFGIDFSGGTRIPVILEHSVDQDTMNELVQTIKKRASVLGLTEVKVRSVGGTEIDVEIPSSDESQIKFIEEILSHQGVYQGIVDGKVALSGDNVYSTSIRASSAQELQYSGADWGVDFSINKEGGEQFAKVVKGKANYPVYMFLDRPNDAVVFLYYSDFSKEAPETATKQALIKTAEDSLKLEEKDIKLYFIDDIQGNTSILPATNQTKAIISETTPKSVKDWLTGQGFILQEFPAEEAAPAFEKFSSEKPAIKEWKAIGLLSAPVLSAQITTGVASYGYQITGSVQETGSARTAAITENVKRIESILKGGSLPVKISLGSRTSLPASLGSEFLKLSIIAIVLSLVVISLFIGLRYMNIKATLPIIAVSISELIILLSVLGSFTIDLAAMAGIIAAIGVGVDAQIVITDEIMKKEEKAHIEEKIEHAFEIIKMNMVVAIVAMLPLLFSGLVEVIGFSVSTILGSLLGFLLSRPTYAVIVEEIIEK